MNRLIACSTAGLLLAAAACQPPDAPPRGGAIEEMEPLTPYVDPFIGTGGHGHVYPGATVPWGMVQLSPDQGQGGWDWIAGYNWEDSVLVGFSHTHLSGTGIGDLLDILIMPVPAYIPVNRAFQDRFDRDAISRFSHDTEEATPGYYAVFLEDHGIQAELTATARVGVHRYTYPATDQPAVFLDLGYAINWDSPVETSLKFLSDTLVTGYRFSRGWARDQKLFFALAFSRNPFRNVALADSTLPLETLGRQEVAGGELRATSSALRALFAFDATRAGDQAAPQGRAVLRGRGRGFGEPGSRNPGLGFRRSPGRRPESLGARAP